MIQTERCPRCGNSALSCHSERRTIRTREGVELSYESHFTRCVTCGEEFLTRAQSRAASREAAGAMRVHAGLLTPTEILAIRKQYRVSQADFESILKLGKKTVVRWESGAVCPSQAADHLLRNVRESPDLFQQMALKAGVQLRGDYSAAAKWCDGPWHSKVMVVYTFGQKAKKRGGHLSKDLSPYGTLAKGRRVLHLRITGQSGWPGRSRAYDESNHHLELERV